MTVLVSVLLWASIAHDVLACGVRVAHDAHHPGSHYREVTLAGCAAQIECAERVIDDAVRRGEVNGYYGGG